MLSLSFKRWCNGSEKPYIQCAFRHHTKIRMVYYDGTLLCNLAKSYGTITMITIATYTFLKIVAAVVNLVKARKYDSLLIIILRNISISDALVSMLSMQMSMIYNSRKINTDITEKTRNKHSVFKG